MLVHNNSIVCSAAKFRRDKFVDILVSTYIYLSLIVCTGMTNRMAHFSKIKFWPPLQGKMHNIIYIVLKIFSEIASLL